MLEPATGRPRRDPDAWVGQASVVIISYRNEGTILSAVRSILAQASPEPVEVIVVTSGGDDAATFVREAFPQVAVVESQTRLLPGASRNAGLAASSGDVVAFLAADCRAEPGWIARRLEHHRAGHAAVASAVTHAGPSTPWSWASYYAVFSERLPGRPEGVVAPPDPAAHSLSFDRAILERIGPFGDSLRIGEDTEAAQRLADVGIEIWFDPAIRTAHLGPRTLRSMLGDHFRRGARRYRYLALTGQVSPPRSLGRVIAWSTLLFIRRTRRTLATSWRYGPGERWRIVLSVPFIVAARGAGVTGRASEELRAARASHNSMGEGERFPPNASS